MRDDNYLINQYLTVLAAFWRPGTDEISTGTLTVDDESIRFTTAPEHEKQATSKDLSSFFARFNAETVREEIPALHGFSEKGICTLCRVNHWTDFGLHDGQSNQIIKARAYLAFLVLIGLHVNGLEDKSLELGAYRISGTSGILPTSLVERQNADSTVLTLKNGSKHLLSLCLLKDRTEISVEAFCSLSTNDEDRARIARPEIYIKIKPARPESLSYFLEMGNRLENLASLLTGGSESLESIRVYQEQNLGVVFVRRDCEKTPFDVRKAIPCTLGQISRALAIWLSEDEGFVAVENVALGVVRRGNLFPETKFLSLAQALEGLHRATSSGQLHMRSVYRDVRVNINDFLESQSLSKEIRDKVSASLAHLGDPSFRNRMRELLERLPEQSLEKLYPNRKEFIAQIVDTRNFLTHTGDSKSSKKHLLAGIELIRVNHRLQAITRALIASHLQLPAEQYENVLVNEATRWG